MEISKFYICPRTGKETEFAGPNINLLSRKSKGIQSDNNDFFSVTCMNSIFLKCDYELKNRARLFKASLA